MGMDAATIIESESRELIRRRGLNVHADQLEPLIREVMSDYDRRSSSGEVPVLRDDDESMVAEVAARIGGFGPLHEMLDDPSIEGVWLNSPSRTGEGPRVGYCSTMTGRRAGIYARISKDDGSALGVGRQIEDCTAEAGRRGWTVGDQFIDNNVSASKVKPRPEYTRMIEAVERGDIDAVVVWDVDRLTRKPAELETFIDLADRHGLSLASVGGEIDLSTPQGRLTARIKGSVARHEAEQMGRRIARKAEQTAREGLSTV